MMTEPVKQSLPVRKSESLKENLQPLNQISKKMLLKVKADANPSMLYSLQLAQWALESGNLESNQIGLQENLESLLLEEPLQVMRFLEGEGHILNNLSQEERNDPLSIAREVLEQLHSRLSAVLPGYPRPRDLPANFR